MEIAHDFSPDGDPDPLQGRLDLVEQQLALCQKALGHDLPNQMVALQGLARVLELELGENVAPEVRAIANRLAALARQADETMRALAALGRLCRQPGPVETLELEELIREAAAETKVLFKRQAVEYHFQDAMPVAVTHRAPLYQLLLQLLRNAYQAAVAEQVLVIELGARRLDAGGIELRVCDTGRGLTEYQMRQVEATLAGKPGGGTGLGLVLVRQVVTGWRGSVCIASEPGQGTVVTVLARTL